MESWVVAIAADECGKADAVCCVRAAECPERAVILETHGEEPSARKAEVLWTGLLTARGIRVRGRLPPRALPAIHQKSGLRPRAVVRRNARG